MKKTGVFQKIIYTIALPLGIYLVFFILTRFVGNSSFGLSDSMLYVIRQTALNMFIALGLAANMVSGRWDFSIGAVITLSAIIGGNLALKMNVSAIVMLLLTIVTAVVISLITGILYITIRISPIVISLGLLMIYEAISGLIFSGTGVNVFNNSRLAVFGQTVPVLILLAIALLLFAFILKKTVFGYNMQALAKGQAVSVSVGINEKKNTLICFILAGVFLGIAAVVYMSYQAVKPATNLASANLMFGALSPVIIGMTLARFSNLPVSLLMATLSIQLLQNGVIALGANSVVQTVISGLFLLAFVMVSGMIEKKQMREHLMSIARLRIGEE